MRKIYTMQLNSWFSQATLRALCVPILRNFRPHTGLYGGHPPPLNKKCALGGRGYIYARSWARVVNIRLNYGKVCIQKTPIGFSCFLGNWCEPIIITLRPSFKIAHTYWARTLNTCERGQWLPSLTLFVPPPPACRKPQVPRKSHQPQPLLPHRKPHVISIPIYVYHKSLLPQTTRSFSPLPRHKPQVYSLSHPATSLPIPSHPPCTPTVNCWQ